MFVFGIIPPTTMETKLKKRNDKISTPKSAGEFMAMPLKSASAAKANANGSITMK